MCIGPAAADDLESEVNKAMVKVEEDRAKAKTWEGRHTGDPYVTLLNEYDTKINADGSYEEIYHSRIRVQKPAAKELGEWPVYYNRSREEIVSIEAFVETPPGNRVAAKFIEDADAFDGADAYKDYQVKVVHMPKVDVGSILDIKVTSKFKGKQIPGHYWADVPYPTIPTKYFRHSFIYPERMPLVFKNYKNKVKPVITKKDGIINHSYVFKDTEGLVMENFMPSVEEINGNTVGSTIADWNIIADWYRGLVEQNAVESPLMVNAVNTLIKDKPDQKAKARAIIEYIQDNFRYVPLDFGSHFIPPRPAEDVFKNKYADSKDVAIFLKVMLKIAGIESHMALMRNELSGDPQKALPNPDVFEHAVLQVNLDGRMYFVDPLTKGFDFGQYPSTYDNAYVFVIDDTSFHFDHFPTAAAVERVLASTNEIKVAGDGSAQFKTHVQLPLEASQAFRSQWAATPEEERKKFFNTLQSNFAQGGTPINHKVNGLENRYGPVEFHLEYKLEGAYPVVNNMVLLKEAPQANIPEFSEDKRQHPIFIPGNSIIKSTNIYHIPDGYHIDFLPQQYSLISEFMDILVDYTRGEKTATTNSTYHLKRSTIPAATYPNIKKFCDTLFQKNDQYIVLKQNSQLNPQAKEWIKNQ